MLVFVLLTITIIVICKVTKFIAEKQYAELQTTALYELGFTNWNVVNFFDAHVSVKSRASFDKYDVVKFFQTNKEKFKEAQDILNNKDRITAILTKYLKKNNHKSHPQYQRLKEQINSILSAACVYRIEVRYTSPAGKIDINKALTLSKKDIVKFKENPSLLQTKAELNASLKAQKEKILNQKRYAYYDQVNTLIDYANETRDNLIIKENQSRLDQFILHLLDQTVNNIRKVKMPDSYEWTLIDDSIKNVRVEIDTLNKRNLQIAEWYESPDFDKIKTTCASLMNSQKEFNDYINEKAQKIAEYFGVRTVRSETINNDSYNYIRPYKKSISPFTAEVSAAVFSSAENNPLDYVVKYFYPNKNNYPQQIQQLYLLIEELETLKEARQIINSYKLDYQQYIKNVPSFIFEYDEKGFYSRLGFANIDEDILTVEYKFVYTSDGGFVQRSFAVPMTEDTIAELIKILENKLTTTMFVKDQRQLMTKKLREHIKERDNYTCCNCGNSVHTEPNLLLEIDHIIPVTKGGRTEISNLQTLCWKCNRAKSNKILS